MMYFIITNSNNFEDFLYVTKSCMKGKNKVRCIVICYCELKLKIIKVPLKS